MAARRSRTSTEASPTAAPSMLMPVIPAMSPEASRMAPPDEPSGMTTSVRTRSNDAWSHVRISVTVPSSITDSPPSCPARDTGSPGVGTFRASVPGSGRSSIELTSMRAMSAIQSTAITGMPEPSRPPVKRTVTSSCGQTTWALVTRRRPSSSTAVPAEVGVRIEARNAGASGDRGLPSEGVPVHPSESTSASAAVRRPALIKRTRRSGSGTRARGARGVPAPPGRARPSPDPGPSGRGRRSRRGG